MIPLAISPWQITSDEVRPDTILDISGSAQYARGHIPGAVNVPYERFQVEAEALVSSTALILVVDPGGARAAEMAVWLRGRGYTVCFLKGGMSAWRGPLESA